MRVFMDDDATAAAFELIGRTGATSLQIGFLHDDVPMEEAAWWAHAQYKGSRITVENKTSPLEAAEGLARRLLTGGQCTHCRKLITLSDFAVARDAILVDGTTWTQEQQAAAGLCRWRRTGRTWKRGCE